LQSEPWLERDKAMIDPIKSLGIEKGRPFNPDATSRAALEAGARDAHDWLNYFYETGLPPYFEGTHWAVPAQMPFVEEAAKGYTTPDFTPSLPALSRNAQKNVDASVDIYFGPQAPQGKESNWVPTKPSGQFEILFRLYGPERLWRLIARVVKEAHAAADWSEVCSLAIDETSSRRGRWYVTVFLDAETHRLLYVAEGRSSHAVEEFAQELAAHGGDCQRIEWVAMDMLLLRQMGTRTLSQGSNRL
jgi:hypothetical protein